MQTAAQARNSSNISLTGLTFIDTLISGATIQGQFYVSVNNEIITEDVITELRNNGYSVVKRNTSNPSFDPYIISW